MAIKVAIIGSGNIGTDLMIKIMRTSTTLEMAVLIGIVPESEGLALARKGGVATTDEGIDGFVEMAAFEDVRIVFDATSARAHPAHAEVCAAHGKQMIDLTPAAAGPYVVPVVNMTAHFRRAQSQHGELWRSGDDPDGRRRPPRRRARPLRRNRRLHRVQVRRSGDTRQHR